ncbi:MAG: rod shape-determining protein MreC [Parasutterella sp.]
MMVVDHQMQVMEPVRSGFAWVSDWIHNGVSSPARGVDFADSYLRSKSSLIAQNEELKKRLAESEMQRYRMSTLSEENRVLKEMLQQKTLYTAKTGMFEVRRALSDGFTQRYQIDGGSNDGLEVGMPVVTEAGLAGQLIHVAPNSSQVQLIQDKNQEVPVLFTTSHVRGIVRGSGDGSTLQSRDLPFSDKIKVGEKVVTSGLDGIYPKGIPVGVVTKVEPGDSGSYINVTVASPKSIGTSEYVLVLYVDTKVELPDLDEEEDAGDGQVRRKPRR